MEGSQRPQTYLDLRGPTSKGRARVGEGIGRKRKIKGKKGRKEGRTEWDGRE